MEKVIGDYLVDLRLDLKDSGAVWSDDELTRCVERAVADYTRFNPLQQVAQYIFDAAEVTAEPFTTPAAQSDTSIVSAYDLENKIDGQAATLASAAPDIPRPLKMTITDGDTSITELVVIIKGYDRDSKYIEERFFLAGGLIQTGVEHFATVSEVEIDKITGNAVGDSLSIGTGDTAGVWIQLANKPIKFQSDTDVSTFTRYTDYIMDYRNGRIAMVSGGSMADGTAYTIDYYKSLLTVDISDLKGLIRVERVKYPTGEVPEEISTFEIWDNKLTLTSKGVETQAEASDDEHLVVYYLAQHTPPDASSPGTYPSFLDQTIELAASAYALFVLALKYEHAAAVLLGNSITGALTNAIKYLDNNSDADAAGILADITTDKAFLRDGIHKTGTPNTGALFEANALLLEVSSIDLDVGSVGAVAWLLEGELKIDKLTDGENVAAHFADYARVKTQIGQTRVTAALGLVQEVAQRLSNLRSYIEQSAGYNRIAEDFIATAAQYQETAGNNMLLADRFRLEAIERRNEAWAIWGSAPQYAAQYTLGQRSQIPPQ